MKTRRIYLDNNSTTALDSRVLEAMLPVLSSVPHNPSSPHSFGKEANGLLLASRERIARVLGAKPHEIIFTSGGTEAMNMLLCGLFPKEISGHAITSNVEHSCVSKTLLKLEEKGLEVSFLPVGLYGAVTPEEIQKAIQPNTKFISLTAVNNETGVKHDLDAIGQIALNSGIPFFVDGVAWLGKELLKIHPGISGIGFSGHKIHGPKGVGFVFIRSSLKLSPLLLGAPQERGMRAGTENLPGILGLAKAIELLEEELPTATQRMGMLRDRLESSLLLKASPVVVNGTGPRICNTSNLSFAESLGEDLLIALDMAGIAVSHGSACASGALEPSKILTNMGIHYSLAKSAIRFSLSRNTTPEEIDQAIEIISEIVQKFRS